MVKSSGYTMFTIGERTVQTVDSYSCHITHLSLKFLFARQFFFRVCFRSVHYFLPPHSKTQFKQQSLEMTKINNNNNYNNNNNNNNETIKELL